MLREGVARFQKPACVIRRLLPQPQDMVCRNMWSRRCVCTFSARSPQPSHETLRYSRMRARAVSRRPRYASDRSLVHPRPELGMCRTGFQVLSSLVLL